MVSSIVSRASALYLALIGLVSLFAADTVLAHLSPGFPNSAAWIGQLIAGAWLALASINWNSRNTILGGIYGRPVVYANLLLYVIVALGVFKPALAPDAPVWIWTIVAPSSLFAAVYGALILRGPFDASPAAR